jgi:hypothetical protein
MINTELFPYEKFGYRLEFGEKKNTTICYFECKEHLDKYLERYKLDKRTLKIDYRDGEPTKFGKTNKTDIQPRTGKNSSGSASGSTRSTKKLDTSGVVGDIGKCNKKIINK